MIYAKVDHPYQKSGNVRWLKDTDNTSQCAQACLEAKDHCKGFTVTSAKYPAAEWASKCYGVFGGEYADRKMAVDEVTSGVRI